MTMMNRNIRETPRKMEAVDHDTFIDDLQYLCAKPLVEATVEIPKLTKEQLLNPNTILAIDNPPTFKRVPN